MKRTLSFEIPPPSAMAQDKEISDHKSFKRLQSQPVDITLGMINPNALISPSNKMQSHSQFDPSLVDNSGPSSSKEGGGPFNFLNDCPDEITEEDEEMLE